MMHEIRLIFRGIRELQRLSPGNLLIKLIMSASNAVIPYINLYCTSILVDGLSNGEPLSLLLLYAGIAIGINLFFVLVSKGMESLNYVKWNQFYLRYNMSIGEKVLSLSHIEIEDPSTHAVIKNLDDAMRIGNFGLIKLHSRLPLFVENAVAACIAVGLIVYAIFQKSKTAYSLLQHFANSVIADIGLVVLVLIVTFSCIYSNGKIAMQTYTFLGNLSKRNRIPDYYLNEYLDGHKAAKDIRLQGQAGIIQKEIAQYGTDSGRIVNALNTTVFRQSFLQKIPNALLMLYAYAYVGIKALSGAFGIGSILKYSGGILQFSTAFTNAMDALAQLHSNTRYLADYFQFMDRKEIYFSGTLPVFNVQHTIEFRDVSFRYPGEERYALSHVSLAITSGSKTAIVGRNGSGKTTLIKLLCRLYEPTEGSILLDGKDIREYQYNDYLSLLGVVFQDFSLVSLSVAEVVAAGREIDEDRIWSVLKMVGIAERIRRMPKGLQTPLYKTYAKDGVEISGGEAQKIALARALYRNPKFVILDEPTAALDPIAEQEIYEQINETVRDKTVLFISHRLSSCRFCSQLIVLDSGCIVQSGSHDELVSETGSVYQQLWQAQAQYYQKQD